MLTALINATFFTGGEMISDRALLISGDRITGFSDPSSIPPDVLTVDCKGLLVTPGLIDLQIAGGGGFLFSGNTSPEALQAITAAILRSGTTGFLLALPTNTHEIISSAFKTIRENPHPAVMGLHLEGPYISNAKRGAHVKELIRHPATSELIALLKEAGGVIKMMTVAPEVCTPEIINILKDNGVTVASGHSNATFREATDGFSWGIESTTHLFNAMSPLHHRDPGLPGAVFNSDKACASIIADAYQHVRQYDRYTLPDGTLSGSKLTMHSALKNCVTHAGISSEEALRMASLYPARLIKASDRGVISPGARADFIIMDSDLGLKGIFFNEKMTLID
jgi:N-acetylglucosamine-6-phosphate deacetylase